MPAVTGDEGAQKGAGEGTGDLSFHGALMRTPWDYFLHPEAFIDWIEGLRVPLANAPGVLRWNHDKRYLRTLGEAEGVELPRTLWLAANERPRDVASLLDALGADRAVVKPAVSGGAHRTRVLERGGTLQWDDDDRGVFLVQAFVDALPELGEWSLVYFDGTFSHAVRKTAGAGDFRVQEEHGGAVHVEAPGRRLHAAAEAVLAAVPGDEPLTYARVDLVEDPVVGPLLMELELIEPELFLRVDPESPGRLARAALRRLGLGG